ncbi:hypothetical protein SVIOM74S_00696 [Streptomyces violarus]
MPLLLGRRAHPLGVVGGFQGGGQRLGEVVALPVVVGTLGSALRGPALPGEQPGERAVQPRPLPGEQIRVDGLTGEGVPEGVRVVAPGDEQLPSHRLAQRRLQLLLGKPDRLPQQLVLHPAPGDGRGPQHLLRGVGQLLEADQQHVGEPAGHPAGLRVRRREQLLRVEGVPLGPLHDPPHRRLRQRTPFELPHQPGHIGIAQRPQLQPLDGGQPYQLREQRPQRMATVQVVRPVRGEHRQPVPQNTPAEQEPQQIPRRLVGPVQILQHEQQRRDIRHIGQQPRHPLEQPQPPVYVPSGIAPASEHPPDRGMSGQGGSEPLVGGEHAQDLGERQIRQPHITEIHAVPGDHGHARFGGPPPDLVQEPSLTDPGVPGDQYRTSLPTPGSLQHAGQPGKFGSPPDNRRDV